MITRKYCEKNDGCIHSLCVYSTRIFLIGSSLSFNQETFIYLSQFQSHINNFLKSCYSGIKTFRISAIFNKSSFFIHR